MTIAARTSVPIRFRPVLQSDGGVRLPRQRLEDCLAAIDAYEAEVQAFVALDIDGARSAADRSTECRRAAAPAARCRRSME